MSLSAVFKYMAKQLWTV